MKSIVVAYDQNNAIGIDSNLPWGHALHADLKHFKDLTVGKSIIMGRKTYESIGKPLPDRQNIIVSHSPVGVPKTLTAGSLEAAYATAQFEVVVIGGGSIYEQALPSASRIYATEIDYTFSSTIVFFPLIHTADWAETSRTHHAADDGNAYSFDFVTYDRIE